VRRIDVWAWQWIACCTWGSVAGCLTGVRKGRSLTTEILHIFILLSYLCRLVSRLLFPHLSCFSSPLFYWRGRKTFFRHACPINHDIILKAYFHKGRTLISSAEHLQLYWCNVLWQLLMFFNTHFCFEQPRFLHLQSNLKYLNSLGNANIKIAWMVKNSHYQKTGKICFKHR